MCHFDHFIIPGVNYAPVIFINLTLKSKITHAKNISPVATVSCVNRNPFVCHVAECFKII